MNQIESSFDQVRRAPSLPPFSKGVRGLSEVGPDSPVSEAIRVSIAQALLQLDKLQSAAHDAQPEGVHQFRTAIRRLRSQLRMFRDLLDPGWIDLVEGELRWLAGVLGDVRDLDVLRARLLRDCDDSRLVLAPLFDRLDQRREEAIQAMASALQGTRYHNLKAMLGQALVELPLTAEASIPCCRDALPVLVRDAWKALKRRGRAIDVDSPDSDYHDVRKKAKRLRYNAESAAKILSGRSSRRANRIAKLARKLQDLLGTHQDAIVAREVVREIASAHEGDVPFQLAAARLMNRQESAAQQARKRFPSSWKKLDRKRNRRWLHV